MIPTREVCSICGNISRVGFWVPDKIWKQVMHVSLQNNIVCLECFAKRADEKLIKLRKKANDIEFFVSTLEYDHQESCRNELCRKTRELRNLQHEYVIKIKNIQIMYNKIKLLKNNDNREDTDLEKINEFYRFLTGEEMPQGISMSRGHAPKMSEKKAFSIIWYLQEHLSIFPNCIERCDSCGELYDSNSEGLYWETKGKNYCGVCSDQVPLNYDRGRK